MTEKKKDTQGLSYLAFAAYQFDSVSNLAVSYWSGLAPLH